MSEAHDPCRLYLRLPACVGKDSVNDLQCALSGGDIACILLKSQLERPVDQDLACQLRETAHAHLVAFLVEDNWQLAELIGADGIHLSTRLTVTEEAYRRARNHLGEESIIGANCNSRHSAMVHGELGAQYVAFGDDNEKCDFDNKQDLELITWWAELFEVPVIAWNVKQIETAESLKRHADFIAVENAIWNHDGGAEQAVKAFNAVLA